MKKIRRVIAAIGIISSFALFISPLSASNFDPDGFGRWLGYKYRVAFDFNDGKVHVYTDTWIRTSTSDVWIGNPHSDMEPLSNPDAGVLIVPSGCVLYAGRGVQVVEGPDGKASKIEKINAAAITNPVNVYVINTKIKLIFMDNECHKHT